MFSNYTDQVGPQKRQREKKKEKIKKERMNKKIITENNSTYHEPLSKE